VSSDSDNDRVPQYDTKWVGFPEEGNWTVEHLEHFLGSGEGMIGALRGKHPNAVKDPWARL